MSLLADFHNHLNEYTKEDLILGIMEIDFRKRILMKLPIIKYNRMCDEAVKVSNQAQEYMNEKKITLASEYFKKSQKIFEDANKFIDKENK
jgi:hypothetical protein